MKSNPSFLKEPWFLSNYGLWGATDAFTLILFIELFPWWYFGSTAQYLGIPTSESESDAIAGAQTAIKKAKVTNSVAEIKAEYPWMFQ